MATLELLQSSITRTILNNDNCKLCHIVATLLQRVMNQIDFFTKKTTKKTYQSYGTAGSVFFHVVYTRSELGRTGKLVGRIAVALEA